MNNVRIYHDFFLSDWIFLIVFVMHDIKFNINGSPLSHLCFWIKNWLEHRTRIYNISDWGVCNQIRHHCTKKILSDLKDKNTCIRWNLWKLMAETRWYNTIMLLIRWSWICARKRKEEIWTRKCYIQIILVLQQWWTTVWEGGLWVTQKSTRECHQS